MEHNEDQNVLMLVNSIPPYRIPLFNWIGKNVSTLIVIYDKLIESDRKWQIVLEDIGFRAQESQAISFTRKGRSDAGSDIHFPLNLYWKIRSAKPNLILTTELGMRTLIAVIYKILHPEVQLTLWLTLSERTERNYGEMRLLLRRFIISHADHIVVASASAERYIATFPEHPKITKAPQAIAQDYDLKYEKSVINIEPVLLIISSNSPRKNTSWAVHRLDEWARKQNKRVSLQIVGELPTSLDLKSFAFLKITTQGFVQPSEMTHFYQIADVLIFPTLADEWGLVVNEALSHSLPVIGSYCAEAVNELISDSYNGWSFNPKDEATFNSALTHFFATYRDQNLYSKMKLAAKDTVTTKATMEALALALVSRHKKSKVATQKTVNVVISMRYLNKYRVPLIQKLSQILLAEGKELRVLGSIPNNAARKNEDLGWHPTYRVVNQFKLTLAKRELRFRFIPRNCIAADIFVSEHAAGNLHNFIILITRKIMRKPTVLMGHGSNITSQSSFLSIIVESIQLRMCTLYLAYTAESAIRAKRLGGERIPTVNFFNSTDTKTLTQLMESNRKNSYAQSCDKWKALYVGSFHSSKNIQQLLSLCSMIHEKDQRFHIVICGEGDQEIFDSMRALSFVEAVGFKESSELAKLAVECKILLSTGRIGLNATDSFALRTPIVGLSAGVLHAPEFEYLNQSNSIILPTIDAVSEAVLRLMKSEGEIENLKNGCDQSAMHYSIERSAEIIAKSISDICKEQN